MPVDPTGQDLKRFQQEGPDGPIVMLNLLRFAEGGRERYAEYVRRIRPFAEKVGGEVVYFGDGAPAVISDGQDWDAVLLARYPSRHAFLEMVADPDYQEITPLRSLALEAAVLQPTTPWQV